MDFELDTCGEYPAFGAVLGEGDGIDLGTGVHFVVDYALPGLVDANVAERMGSICAFESAA